MIKEPRELKAGQIIVMPPAKNGFIRVGNAYQDTLHPWRFGIVKKHINGIPRPGLLIEWEDHGKSIHEYDHPYPWNCIHIANNEQEKLALLMKLS